MPACASSITISSSIPNRLRDFIRQADTKGLALFVIMNRQIMPSVHPGPGSLYFQKYADNKITKTVKSLCCPLEAPHMVNL